MADDDMTGPWVLALGTLAVGVAAVTAEVLRRRTGADGADGTGGEGNTADAGAGDAEREPGRADAD